MENENQGNVNKLLRKQPGHLLRRGYQKSIAIVSDNLNKYELRPLQLTVLIALNESGPCTQRELSNLIAVEPSSLHPMLRRMQEMKLVNIRVSEVDKRRSHIDMTAKGKDLLEKVRPLQIESSQVLLEDLTEQEQQELIRLLEKIIDNNPV